jgi:hypothetical protein
MTATAPTATCRRIRFSMANGNTTFCGAPAVRVLHGLGDVPVCDFHAAEHDKRAARWRAARNAAAANA